MELTEEPRFEHKDRHDIYEYVERHGSIDPERLRRTLSLDRRAFGHHVAILKRDNVLEERDGTLGIAFEPGTKEELETDGIEVTIRQAREKDLTGLVGAIRTAIGSGESVRAETVADVVDNEGVLIRHNEIESRVFFVATVETDVVGWVHLKHPELDKLSHTAQMTLGVLEEYRGHGIGSRLLERGIEWAEMKGLEKVDNAIPRTNESAIEFLKERGWETEGVREDHYKLDGEYVDEVVMAREV